MTENWKEEPQEDLQSKLTLYVMGEACEATRAEVEAALQEDDVLREQHEELVRALDLLRQPQLQPVLDQDRRSALREAAAAGPAPVAPIGKIFVMPKWGVAAALLIFGGMITIWQQPWRMPQPESSQSAVAGELGYISDSEALSEMGYSGGPSLQGLGYMSEGGSSFGYNSESEVVNLERQRDNLRRDLNTKRSKGAPLRESLAVEEFPLGEFNLSPSSPSAPASTLGTPATPGMDLKDDFSPALDAADDMRRFRALGYVGDGDEQAEEVNLLARSESLYEEDSAGAYFDDFEDGDFRARTENILGEYGKRLGGGAGCIVQDGYGRRYQDQQVLLYLKPQYAEEKPSDMFFRFYGDNPEIYTRHESLSTFAADVDTASYPMTRNYLVNGQLPPKASIRTEEFLNYFDYGMTAPQEDDFAVQLQATQSKFGTSDQILLSVGIKAKEVAAADRKPMNLVFVIDKSGSMAGTRMQLVKDALMLLVDQIRDTDTIGLVTFDSRGHIVLEATPGTERFRIREAIRSLGTGGSTNAGEGLALGYQLMEKVYHIGAINRVVLASDGVANTGVTDQETILQQVVERAEAKVDLTTLGVGMGNHNDVFLEQLADQGNGSCHYLDDLEEAKRVLVEGFLGTMITVARDVKIQVEFDAKQVLRWRQLGYENRSLLHQDFRNDAVDAGEVGSGHEVVALYEVAPTAEADFKADFVTVRLRWKPEGSDKAVERTYTLNLAAGKGRWDLAPVRLREMGVVAQYAEVLRRSWHAREDSYPVLQKEAKRLAGELAGEPEVRELSAMIDRTAKLARWAPPQDDLSLLLEEARRQRLLEAELVLASGKNEVQELLNQVRQQNLQLEGQLEKMLQRD